MQEYGRIMITMEDLHMKRTFLTASLLAVSAMLFFAQTPASAQTDVEIGKTVIRIQSPIEINSKTENRQNDAAKKKNRPWPITYSDLYFGFSFPIPGCNYEPTPQLPVHYGNSFEIQLGYRQWFRPARHYAIGLSVQYTHYDFRTTGLLLPGTIAPGPFNGQITREIFKSDNLGFGIYNRIFVFAGWPGLHIDLGAWGDWAFSNQYKTKYMVADSKEVDHYRDGTKFFPLQGGVYGAIGVGAFSVYCKYRFTNMFNHSYIAMEPPRMSIGLVVSLSDLF